MNSISVCKLKKIIFWFYILEASCIKDVRNFLELNDYCLDLLKNENSKWENYKLEISDIRWLCKMNSHSYVRAQQELTESLSRDFETISKKGCFP